ncbi:hypothetical protein BKA70DRAFT_1444703 [Coprinopsis sp. MPI-PUGE-AT-0042]|nr:hypothetical protein BKA70DRAFT_1444703 [Coprinopsis sp. MPI-PUGE-AT-0042]
MLPMLHKYRPQRKSQSINIQLDDCQPSPARFMESLTIEGDEEKEWILRSMANIAAILEYGRLSGLLHKFGVMGSKDTNVAQAATVRVMGMAKKSAAGVLGGFFPQEDRKAVNGDEQATRLPILHRRILQSSLPLSALLSSAA